MPGTGGAGDLPVVRTADRRDLPGIVAVYNQAVAERFATADLEPRSVDDRIPWFEAHPPRENPIFVCEQAGELLGWCSISAYRPGRRALGGTREVSFYVDSANRGRGVGSRLLSHAVASGPAIGARALFAVVIEGNRASLRLLERHGFEKWGFLPDVVDVDGIRRGHVYLGRQV